MGFCGGAFTGAHLETFGLQRKVRTIHSSIFGDSSGYLEGDAHLSKGKSPHVFDLVLDIMCRGSI